MSNYKSGASEEYKLAKYLWEDGWMVVRQAASGAVRHEAADVVAIKDGRVLVFEVKSSKKDDYRINVDDQLFELSDRIGLYRPSVQGGCYYAIRDPQWMVADIDIDVLTPDTPKEKLINVIR